MNLYESINDIKVFNYDMIQQGMKKGFPDFRYMIVGSEYLTANTLPKVRKKDILKLSEAYLNILYQLPEVDTELSKLWKLYELHFDLIRAKSEANELRQQLGRKMKKIDFNKLNVAFSSYRSKLEESYTDFELSVYFLKPDFIELWKEKYPDKLIPEILKERKEIEFFIFEEYFALLDKYSTPEYITTHYKSFEQIEALAIMRTENFVLNFIDVKTVKSKNLKNIERHLSGFFKERNEWAKWRIIRGDFFSYKRLKFLPKREGNTIIDDTIILNDVAGQNIDPKECTLYNYYKIKQYAQRKHDLHEKLNKKPNAR